MGVFKKFGQMTKKKSSAKILFLSAAFQLKGEIKMNKKVTIIPSTESLKKTISTDKEIYNCLGIFPTITDLRKFEFLKSTVSMYKAI